MIDHISIAVRDIKASARFYEALLAPLGMTPVRASPKTVGFGKTYPEFWINERAQQKPLPEDAGAHVALRAPDTKAVDAFHAAALAAGAHSDGAPGMRHEYSPHYYAAFIRDWDGNRIEAVTFLKDARVTRSHPLGRDRHCLFRVGHIAGGVAQLRQNVFDAVGDEKIHPRRRRKKLLRPHMVDQRQ